jgi:hypothetical protein
MTDKCSTPPDIAASAPDCSDIGPIAPTTIGEANPMVLYLSGLADAFPVEFETSEIKDLKNRISEGFGLSAGLTRYVAKNMISIAEDPETPAPIGEAGTNLEEAAKLLEKAGEIIEGNGSLEELEELARQLEEKLNDTGEALGETNQELQPEEMLILFIYIFGKLSAGFGPLLISIAHNGLKTRKDSPVPIDYFNLATIISDCSVHLETALVPPEYIMFPPLLPYVACPFIGRTTYCRDFYLARLSCTPATWQRVIGGVGGPSGLYHITCRWMVSRRTKVVTSSYRTRLDRWLARRPCGTAVTTAFAGRIQRYNHFKASLKVPAGLPAPFNKSC